MKGAIGVFDSGYGGLTVLKEIVEQLPSYDYLYLGDNARAPYGPRSFNTIYNYTRESVQWFFNQGCPLVILACNTASAKALRSIQQKDLREMAPEKRVLGVIRPTSEKIGVLTQTKHVGILGTKGTIQSGSYQIEIEKFFPGVRVYQEACPMWVPLIENNEYDNAGADYFIRKHLDNILAQSNKIDTLLLACTHYPLLKEKIIQFLPNGINVLAQGEIVANSLAAYLARHPEIDINCTRNGKVSFFTTDSAEDFNSKATIFYGQLVTTTHVEL